MAVECSIVLLIKEATLNATVFNVTISKGFVNISRFHCKGQVSRTQPAFVIVGVALMTFKKYKIQSKH